MPNKKESLNEMITAAQKRDEQVPGSSKTIEIDHKKYAVTFECDGGSGGGYKKWHNFTAESLTDPENDFYGLQICQENEGEAFFNIEVFHPEKEGDHETLVGEWKELSKVVRDKSELTIIQDLLTTWSDDMLQKTPDREQER